MDIFIIRHLYDNGLSFEDKVVYQEDKYYSTRELAAKAWCKIGNPFEGRYTLLKVTVNTQETEVIVETQYNPCRYKEPELEREYYEELMENTTKWQAEQEALETKMLEEYQNYLERIAVENKQFNEEMLESGCIIPTNLGKIK